MNHFFIAASEMDVIIGIIAVVGWILAQIFSKKKVDSSSQEESTPESGAPIDPRDELRKFFAELEKSATPHPPPQPVVQPPVLKKVQRDKPARRDHETRQETLSSQNRPVYSAAESAQVFQETPMRAAIPHATRSHTHSSAMPDLRNPIALRKLIIANEILGKPIALRQ